MKVKLSLDIYNTEYGKGFLLFENGFLISHFLPGSSRPDGDFNINRKAGILARKLEKYFQNSLIKFNDKIKIEGTAFEKKVYNACCEIPYGETVTYKELAHQINSKAYRAVGKALAKNKLPIIIPCHRVVSLEGLGGWSGPKGMKEMLLSMEMRTIVKY